MSKRVLLLKSKLGTDGIHIEIRIGTAKQESA